jgi:hypothetical protein
MRCYSSLSDDCIMSIEGAERVADQADVEEGGADGHVEEGPN